MSRYLLSRIGACRPSVHVQGTTWSAWRAQTRFFASQILKDTPPVAKNGMTTESFLTAIGRDSVSKIKVREWDKFWSLDGWALKDAGLAVRDRRYILWCMEKFRQGYDPKDFAHPPTPKKKIRGHGPAVQNGKRIRSRRSQ